MLRVAPQEVGQPITETADRPENARRCELRFVVQEKASQSHQIGARPITVNKGFSGADVGAAKQARKEPPAVNLEPHDLCSPAVAPGEGVVRSVRQPNDQVAPPDS